MAVKCIENMALPQIPDLQGCIVRATEQIPSIWMEINLINITAMSIIMLNKPLASNVPNLDALVLAATSHTGAIWMEPDRVDAHIVIAELVDQLARAEIPKLQAAIIRA